MKPTIEHLISAGVSSEKAAEWIDAIVAACEEFNIDTAQRVAYFIGQCAHETGGFKTLEENLNYSADSMANVWPNRFAVVEPDPDKPGKTRYKLDKGRKIPNKFALALHRKPELIANSVYANRMGNGPVESGDGWKHRGMGLKQLTGLDNHRRCGLALGADFVNHPELLLTPQYAARSAAWFWSTNNLSAFADKGDIEGMTRKVNGGLIGIDDRKKRCNAVLGCSRAAYA